MKYIIIATITLICMACQKNEPQPICSCAPPADSLVITVKYGKTTTPYDCCNNKISATFNSLINESRCPTSVQCIAAGTASIGVLLNGTASEALELNKPITKTLMTLNWKITLTKLTPYPMDGALIDPTKYKAEIKFIRQ